MAQSLRGGVWGTMKRTVVDSLTAEILRRDAIASVEDKADDIKQTFTHWNICMTKDYCKWPAVGVIIILSLIIIGVTICIIRCCCLGLSCCCSCFRCLKCCGNCCGCCDSPGDRPHKYSHEPFGDQQKKPGAGYRQQAPMEAHFPPPPPTAHSVKPSYSGPPQYAEFDMKRPDPDALPAMPSWEESQSKKMMVEELEMDNLPQKEPPVMQRMPPQRGPMPGNNPYAVSELPGHGYNMQQGNAANYMNAHGNVYDQGQQHGYDQGLGHMPQGHDMDQPYGGHSAMPAVSRHPTAPIQTAYGPRQLIRQAPTHTSMQATVFELDGHDRFPVDTTSGHYGADPQQNGYADMPPYASPPQSQGPRSPPLQGDYGHPPAAMPSPRSPNLMGNVPARVDSPRTIAYKTYNPAPENNPSITNNGGFDFNSGYSRPQTHDEPEVPDAYPGYKAYNSSTPGTPVQQRRHLA
ncbi:hypothetical protein ESCO_000864 [Escovopsis weberi]|uniref:Fibroin-3 related protein n=1 Tax=Escovopsis weberi TaxID=150374 RepID=A0A0M8MXN9_ESCWE|nr:hypothetical protein ESCO_000864 [Escovopsis weberi]